nr:MAG TPA: hypothetical protein [Caudoviricetes sp.]
MEQVFIDNPKLDVAYKTADGHFFFLENDAVNYASTLEDKTVEKVTPKREKTAETVDNTADEQGDKQKVSELMELELIPKNFNKMKSLATYFKVELAEKPNAEDLIKALTELKNQITQ